MKKVRVCRSENSISELGNNNQLTNFVPLFQMVTFKDLVRYKTSLGKAESLREFGSWYQNKWKRDYPMAYSRRWNSKRRLMVTGRSRARVRQSKRVKRYRGTAKGKRAAFSKTNIGKRVGEATAKRFGILADWQSLASRTKAIINLTGIPKSTAASLTARDRDIINLRGFQIHFDFQVLGTVYQYVNMAILSPKDALTVEDEDFFRTAGLDSTRYVDFSNALSSMQFAHLGLNTDRYTVLLHKRWKVNTRIESASVNRGIGSSDWRTYKTYVKVNRQISYDSASSQQCNDPIFMVIWTDQPGAIAASTPAPAVLQWASLITTYFKEPKN